MVKLRGRKYDLYKKNNVIRQYNNRSREDWFFVDDITCRTVQEQEQRLIKATGKTSNKNYLHIGNKAKRIKTGR